MLCGIINSKVKSMNKIDGRYLKELREERGYSLREFAQMIYVSKSSVQRWEKSSVPESGDVLEEISKAFGISVEDMREQSAEKYGVSEVERFSPEERAEARFGIKGLVIAMAVLGVALALGVILPIVL